MWPSAGRARGEAQYPQLLHLHWAPDHFGGQPGEDVGKDTVRPRTYHVQRFFLSGRFF